jgi:hypothetical protein
MKFSHIPATRQGLWSPVDCTKAAFTSTGFSCASQWYLKPAVHEDDERAIFWPCCQIERDMPPCPKLVTIVGKIMTCRQDNRVALKALRYCDIRMYTLSGYINVLTLQKAILII